MKNKRKTKRRNVGGGDTTAPQFRQGENNNAAIVELNRHHLNQQMNASSEGGIKDGPPSANTGGCGTCALPAVVGGLNIQNGGNLKWDCMSGGKRKRRKRKYTKKRL